MIGHILRGQYQTEYILLYPTCAACGPVLGHAAETGDRLPDVCVTDYPGPEVRRSRERVRLSSPTDWSHSLRPSSTTRLFNSCHGSIAHLVSSSANGYNWIGLRVPTYDIENQENFQLSLVRNLCFAFAVIPLFIQSAWRLIYIPTCMV